MYTDWHSPLFEGQKDLRLGSSVLQARLMTMEALEAYKVNFLIKGYYIIYFKGGIGILL